MKLETAVSESTQIALNLLKSELAEPVLPFHSPEAYLKKIDLSLGEEGCSEAAFFEQLEQIALLTPKTNSKAFFNQLFAGRNPAALSAEIVRTVLNTTMHTYKVAGIQVLIEQEIVRQFLLKVGYTNGEGIINPGGSISNMISMMIARNEKSEQILTKGIYGARLIAYSSADCHYSIRKNAAILGLGKDNVRLVETDARGRMRPEALEKAILEDLALGHLPFYINATAGTTVFGAFDPFTDLSAIAKKYQLWFHIDAALAGSALLSQQYKHLLEGSELSDSFTWNAHKMMNVPITASFLLMKDKGLMTKHLSEKADYLFQNDELDLDLGNASVQCGRPVDALKVWCSWKYYGEKGLEARINQLFMLTDYAAEIVRKNELFELYRDPESVTLCFNVKAMRAEDVCALLHQKGLAMVGYSKNKGESFIRLACINADLQTEDIDNFFECLKNIALSIETV